MGDTYAASVNGRSAEDTKAAGKDDRTFRDKPFSTVGNGLKPKDLTMLPARVALALHADGWWLRSDIIWAKPNPMPESAADRPTSAHEHVFLLGKRAKYFYDAESVREESVTCDPRRPYGSAGKLGGRPVEQRHDGEPRDGYRASRNLRNIWTIPTEAFPGAHFATFPTELVGRCIKAGTSEKGCCPLCGAQWARVTGRSIEMTSGSGRSGRKPQGKHGGSEQAESGAYDIRMGPTVATITIGWRPSCSCPERVPIPCTVLDPFAGAGTTGLVADRLGRNAVLIELNPSYTDMAGRRIQNDLPLFVEINV
jgi:hypothetical protein